MARCKYCGRQLDAEGFCSKPCTMGALIKRKAELEAEIAAQKEQEQEQEQEESTSQDTSQEEGDH